MVQTRILVAGIIRANSVLRLYMNVSLTLELVCDHRLLNKGRFYGGDQPTHPCQLFGLGRLTEVFTYATLVFITCIFLCHSCAK